MMPASVHILLVEDDEDDVLIMRELLKDIEETCFKIDWVQTYDEAIQRLNQVRYDIHFFDYRLGQATGLDLVHYVQTRPSPAPSIILTGLNDRHVDLVAGQMGATDYVIKGDITPSGLERSIRYAIERRRVETERETLTQQLLETSRQLGMAENAAHVLHNVGNVLNSISVSASVILDILKEPFVEDIRRIALMIKDHHHDLAGFLSKDHVGNQIPIYLDQSSEHVTQQHKKVLEEILCLTANLEHVNHIIQAQQSIAKSQPYLESVNLPDIMDRALAIVQTEPPSTFEVQRDYSDIPFVMTDKHQLLQILVNLIRNAKQAMTSSSGRPHQLGLSISRKPATGEMVHLSVQDSGIGISRDNLTSIFAQRFTTKPEGQGIGLHSSALAAKQLGGRLHAESAGPGLGAKFTLSLPLSPMETYV